MTSPHVLRRPPSFGCLTDWLGLPGAELWMASPPGMNVNWIGIEAVCDPKVFNEGVRSRWDNPHYG